MKSLVVVSQLFLLVGILTVTGCADNSADGLMKQSIAEMNKIADGLEAGKTEADMKASTDRAKAIVEKLDALGLSDEEKEKLLERHAEGMQEAEKRMGAAAE